MEVNSFWSDGDLSALEQLCLASFVRRGHAFNLYVYDPPGGVPAGVVLRDAAEFLTRDRLFRYQAGIFNLGSVAGFSNLFRYTLIHRFGGWWVDTDLCLLGEIDPGGAEVFFREPSREGEGRVASSCFKAQAGSPALAHCLKQFEARDVRRLEHGETGPILLTEGVHAAGQSALVRPGAHIFPLPWWEYEKLWLAEDLDLRGGSAVHFWNAKIRDAELDKNARYPAGSIFERLRHRFLESDPTSDETPDGLLSPPRMSRDTSRTFCPQP